MDTIAVPIIEIEEAERPEESPAYKRYLGTLCSCGAADPCPLGKRGAQGRCTTEELRSAFIDYQNRVRSMTRHMMEEL